MTTSLIRYLSASRQGDRTRTPWSLYAALGLFLLGIFCKACTLVPLG